MRLFGLSPFEAELLLLAAGAEIDSTLPAALAALQGTAGGPGVNVAVALARLPGAHWDALSPLAPAAPLAVTRRRRRRARPARSRWASTSGCCTMSPRRRMSRGWASRSFGRRTTPPPAGDDARPLPRPSPTPWPVTAACWCCCSRRRRRSRRACGARAGVGGAAQQPPLHALVDSALEPDFWRARRYARCCRIMRPR
ncbi:MAG: hypothetical protein KIT28_09650 [Rubrivivax sp.]|nr:hypothetical protein [Rubrivivax sp.]